MAMRDDEWRVLDVVRNADGGTTLTMQNARGNIRTEDYPPGATITRVRRAGDGDEPV